MTITQQRPDRPALAAHLASSAGVITAGQLVGLGFDAEACATLVRRGELVRVNRGVYRATAVPMTLEGELRAALATAGSAYGLVLASSAHWHGLIDYPPIRPQLGCGPDSIDLRRSVPWFDRHPLPRLEPDDLVVVRGICCTSRARTVLDLLRRARGTSGERLAGRALRSAFLDDRRLAGLLLERIDREPRVPGNRIARRLIAQLPGTERLRSDLEFDFVQFCVEHGLPAPATNQLIAGFEVDAVFASARLAVELDTRAFHDDPIAFERDRARDAKLMALGWRVLRITGERLERDPVGVAAELRAILSMAG